MGLFDQHNKATFNVKGSKKACAEAIFGKDERVEEVTFDKCFFGASDLEFDPFVRAIVGNYGSKSGRRWCGRSKRCSADTGRNRLNG
jgi:hypothetical protein